MADTDFASFATSLIPAAVGAAFGGAPGAVYGLAQGLSGAGQQRAAYEKANADIAFKNIEVQQKHEGMILDRQKYESLDRHYQVLEGKIKDEMLTAAQNRDHEKQKFDLSLRDDNQRREFAKTIKDPAAQQLYMDKPELYWRQRDEYYTGEEQIAPMAAALSTYKLPKGLDPRSMAATWDKKMIQQFILNEQRNQQELQQTAARERADRGAASLNRYNYVFSPEQGGFFVTDRQSQSIGFKSIDGLGDDNPAIKNADRIKAQGELRRRYEHEYPKEALDRPAYTQWLARPENKLAAGELTREPLTPGGRFNQAEYDEARAAMQQRNQLDADDGQRAMQDRWAQTNGHTVNPQTRRFPPEVQARWEKYAASPDGKAHLQGWIEHEKVRSRNDRLGGAPRQAAPAGAPAAPRRTQQSGGGKDSLLKDFGL